MITNKSELLAACNAMCKNTLMETLQIEFTNITETTIEARMPVTTKVHQPNGVLHGGATVALAESVGSAGSYIINGDNQIQVRGIEISANHVKSIKEGFVYAYGEMVHKGRTLQLWHITIKNEQKELISFVKLTTIILHP